MEGELVTAAGYPIERLRVRGLSRSLSPENIRILWEMRRAVGHAKALIRSFSPDIVIGTGGYACYPTLRAAAAMGIPTAVHESNAVPGLAVKRLSGRVDRVWLNFASASALLPHANVRVVGNPIRANGSFEHIAAKDGFLRVLSFGGSLGADEINRAALELMLEEQKSGKIRHLHATGKKNFEAVQKTFLEKGLGGDPCFSLTPFIENMSEQLARADVVIARAGAMTVSELALWGKCAVLIPSPNVTGNHQYKNAKVLADAGAAYLLEERFLQNGGLTTVVMALLNDGPRRMALANEIKAFAKPNANRLILEDIFSLIKK